MNNLEAVLEVVIPNITKGIILIGIVVSLVGTTVAFYGWLKKKMSYKEIKTYLAYTLGIGILFSLSGLLVNFICNFDINFSSYKQSVPIWYIVSLVIFLLLAKKVNQSK